MEDTSCTDRLIRFVKRRLVGQMKAQTVPVTMYAIRRMLVLMFTVRDTIILVLILTKTAGRIAEARPTVGRLGACFAALDDSKA